MILKMLGIYIALDGIVSIVYFIKTASFMEQFARVVRTIMGIYLMII